METRTERQGEAIRGLVGLRDEPLRVAAQEAGHDGDVVPGLAEEDDGGEEDNELRYPHYQPWLTVKGERLKALGEELFAAIPPPAVTPGRRPRKDATERRKLAVMNLLADIVVLALSPLKAEAMVISFCRDAMNRYNRAPFTLQVMHQAALALEYLGIITIEVGTAHMLRSRIRVSEGFSLKLQQLGIDLSEIGKADNAETILLRSRGRRGEAGELLDYRDDETSNAMRAEMEALNAGMNAADVRLDGQPIGPIHMVRIFQHSPGSTGEPWSRHGRIYRGIHLALPKVQRYRLTMAGEELCDLDWSSCHLRIAYAMVGAVPPEGDLYAIPGLGQHRDVVKDVVSAFFSRRPPEPGREHELWVARLPRGAGKMLPSGWDGRLFREALSELHPAIAHLFGEPDLCFTFMRIEARMLLDALKELREAGGIGLPCHDGMLVQRRFKTTAITAMQEASLKHLGMVIPVTEKTIWRP